MGCFNSLQTGKRIQSEPLHLMKNGKGFQFPSNGKAYPKRKKLNLKNEEFHQFQFPSNGKAYPKKEIKKHSGLSIKFQFPSNGKADPKGMMLFFEELAPGCVSIPFKRESVSKGNKVRMDRFLDQAFQFPSNGKAYPKVAVVAALVAFLPLSFQFPSNGKAYPKSCYGRTSISFQQRIRLRFNSLQTGKRIQRFLGCLMLLMRRASFNSLQTGKRIQSQKPPKVHYITNCFNSLQTGKRIQRRVLLNARTGGPKHGFNSLQTGKRIQS